MPTTAAPMAQVPNPGQVSSQMRRFSSSLFGRGRGSVGMAGGSVDGQFLPAVDRDVASGQVHGEVDRLLRVAQVGGAAQVEVVAEVAQHRAAVDAGGAGAAEER